MRIEEFEAEKTWWGNRVENEFAWKVSADEIKARNYNLDIKNPHSPDIFLITNNTTFRTFIPSTKARKRSSISIPVN
jgi:type I restriction enzyme M protein